MAGEPHRFQNAGEDIFTILHGVKSLFFNTIAEDVGCGFPGNSGDTSKTTGKTGGLRL